MPLYWEQSASGVLVENSDTEEEDEDCEIQKPQMQNIEDEEQMEDPVVNTILIFDLQMTNKSVSNNCKSEGFGMQISKDDMSRVLAKSTTTFVQSSMVNLLAQSIKKLVQSTDVWSHSIN